MNTSLKAKTIRALSWSFLQEAAQRGLQFTIGILLARMLGPEEFGLLAMLGIFIGVAQALLDSGFGAALIQRKEPTPAEESSVFYFNLLIGLVLGGALCLGAPAIAAFYHQPQLVTLTRVLSLVLLINGFAVVQNALMVRRLDFKAQTLVSVSSAAFSGVVGLAMAWRGFGVWSLVAQQLSASVLRAGLLWVLNSWRPGWTFSYRALRGLFAYGSGMVASSLLNTAFDNIYSLVIGRTFSAVTLGYYNRAANLSGTVSQSLGLIANRVTFPVFAQLQTDPARLRRGLQKALTTIAFLQFPMMLGVAAVAKPLVLLLLTETWAPCIPLLQALCLVGLLYPMHLLNLNVLTAMGRTDLFFRLEVIKKALIIANIAITFHWGILAMVWGQLVTSVLAYFLNGYYTKQFIGYSIPDQLRELAPYLAAAAVMAGVVMVASLPLPAGHPGQLGFKVLLGVTVYGIISRGFRLSALDEVWAILRRRNPVPA